MTFKRFSELNRKDAIDILCERYANNLIVTSAILDACAKNDWCYRVSSDLFPLLTYDVAKITYDDLPNREHLDKLFDICAKKISCHAIRVSCHPDQFNVLASENKHAVERTIVELNHHGWLMSKLGTSFSHQSPINIHVNASKGDASEIAKRFIDNFERLSDDVKTRLVVENEDKGLWNVTKMIAVLYKITNLPITFDYLHHKCNNDGMSEEVAFNLCYESWRSNIPLFHYSESLPAQKNLRKHADVPTCVPKTYGKIVDIDYEFKHKDAALMKAKDLSRNVDIESADFVKFDSNKLVDNVITSDC